MNGKTGGVYEYLPQPQSQNVREEEGWNEHLKKFCGENAPFLHGPTFPHAQRRRTLGVPEVELPGDKMERQTSEITC